MLPDPTLIQYGNHSAFELSTVQTPLSQDSCSERSGVVLTIYCFSRLVILMCSARRIDRKWETQGQGVGYLLGRLLDLAGEA